ncbi:MAG: NUDIX hydrolase [Bacillaceae bacterium]|nr:NUDIX hydrolase [Bacillaceae bacterium]
MNYIQQMRTYIGHDVLFTVGCGAIIEKDNSILLQHRMDEDNWCVPGGVMEIGESFEEAVKRETFEETGIEIIDFELFGIYSGEKCFVEYPNKDQVYSVQIIFKVLNYKGELKQQGPEAREHRFFTSTELPKNLNPRQQKFIQDWARGADIPIVD